LLLSAGAKATCPLVLQHAVPDYLHAFAHQASSSNSIQRLPRQIKQPAAAGTTILCAQRICMHALYTTHEIKFLANPASVQPVINLTLVFHFLHHLHQIACVRPTSILLCEVYVFIYEDAGAGIYLNFLLFFHIIFIKRVFDSSTFKFNCLSNIPADIWNQPLY
jgi:hypothetical protein